MNLWQQIRSSVNAIFHRKKPPVVPSLRPVASAQFLKEYRGALRAAGPRTKYSLYLSRITPAARIALLGEGFKGVEGTWPTHSVYCTHELNVDKGRTRLLFNVLLGFDDVRRPAQDKAAIAVTQILKKRLEKCEYPQFVIRKRTRKEFNWPQEDGQLDQYWLIEAGRAYKSVMADMQRLGLLVDSDRTEIQ